MAGLDIKLERRPEGVLAHLSGSVDTSTVENLERSIQGLVKGGSKNIVIDLAGVDYVNSRGMALFIKHNDALKQAGARLVLTGLNEKVRPMFEVMGLLDALDVSEDLSEVFKPAAPEEKTVKCPGCAAELPVEGPGTYRCSACSTPFRVTKSLRTRTLTGRKGSWMRVDIPLKGRFAAVVRQAVMSLAEEHLLEGAALWHVVDEVLGALVESVSTKTPPSLEINIMADQEGMGLVMLASDRLKNPEENVAKMLEALGKDVKESEWLDTESGLKALRLAL